MLFRFKHLIVSVATLNLIFIEDFSRADKPERATQQLSEKSDDGFRRGTWSEGSENPTGPRRTSGRKRNVRDQFNFYNIRPSDGQQTNSRPNYRPNYPPDDAEDLSQPNQPYAPYQPNQLNQPYPPNQPSQPYQPYQYGQPYQPYPQYQSNQPYQQYQQNPPYQPYPPYPSPQPYPPYNGYQQQPYSYPPYGSQPTTPSSDSSDNSESTPIGYMLIDSYTSARGTSYSQPVAFFIKS